MLYQVIQNHYLEVKNNWEAQGRYIPKHAHEEFDKFLKCGILSVGFSRIKCIEEGCGHDFLVAFSCKGRSFCLSCVSRKRDETAFHLVENIFYEFPVRQFVLSFPFHLRFIFAFNPSVMNKVQNIFQEEVARFYKQKGAEITGESSEIVTGSVVCIQRFGSSLNLNIHFHLITFGGYFYLGPLKKNNLSFNEISDLLEGELASINERIIQKVIKYLEKNGLCTKKDDISDLNPLDGLELTSNEMAQVASIQGSFAFETKSGIKSSRLGQQGTGFFRAPPLNNKYLSNIDEFSLHAGVSIHANDHAEKQNLISYIFRGPVSNSRLTFYKDGNMVLQLKRPFSDGTYAITFSPTQFIERLIALVPAAGLNLVRYFGLLANRNSWRDLFFAMISELKKEREGEKKEENERPTGKSLELGPEHSVEIETNGTTSFPGGGKRRYQPWAVLLKKVYGIDIFKCSKCGGQTKILAVITKTSEVNKILTHLQMSTAPQCFKKPDYIQQEFSY